MILSDPSLALLDAIVDIVAVEAVLVFAFKSLDEIVYAITEYRHKTTPPEKYTRLAETMRRVSTCASPVNR